MLFTLTFEGRVKSQYESFLAKSIHSWDQFMEMFLAKNHNYDELQNEINSLQKEKEESIEQLFDMMTKIWFIFHLDNTPLKEEMLETYEYILSQSPDEDEKDMADDDASDEVNKEVPTNKPPVRHANQCHLDDVYVDTINPSTYMSCTAEKIHKEPQPKEDLHLHINGHFSIIRRRFIISLISSKYYH